MSIPSCLTLRLSVWRNRVCETVLVGMWKLRECHEVLEVCWFRLCSKARTSNTNAKQLTGYISWDAKMTAHVFFSVSLLNRHLKRGLLNLTFKWSLLATKRACLWVCNMCWNKRKYNKKIQRIINSNQPSFLRQDVLQSALYPDDVRWNNWQMSNKITIKKRANQ